MPIAKKKKKSSPKVKRGTAHNQNLEELFASVSAPDTVTEFLEVLSVPAPDLASAARALANGLKSRPVIRRAFERLETDLPVWLRYHAPAHTDRVFRYAILLALADKLPSREIELLGIAASYHDLGYVEDRNSPHEEVGAEMVASAMQDGGYSKNEIEIVQNAIIDTKLWPCDDGITLEQCPKTKIGKYVADADLSNFGMSDFLEQSRLVFQEQQFERKGAERRLDDAGVDELMPYLEAVNRFFTNHHWHTGAAKRIFGPVKTKNAKSLKKAMTLLRKVKNGQAIPQTFFELFV